MIHKPAQQFPQHFHALDDCIFGHSESESHEYVGEPYANLISLAITFLKGENPGYRQHLSVVRREVHWRACHRQFNGTTVCSCGSVGGTRAWEGGNRHKVVKH